MDLNYSLALKLATLSRDIYALGGFDISGDSQCAYAFLPIEDEYKSVALVFQGSNDALDWFDNLNRNQIMPEMGARALPFGQVHGGMWTSLRGHLSTILLKVSEYRRSGFTVYGTGHSRGGAQVQLAAAYLAYHNTPLEAVYTFGSPMVGNGAFATWMSFFVKKLFNFRNKSDVVPLAPLVDSWWSFVNPLRWLSIWSNRYQRAGHLIWFDGQRMHLNGMSLGDRLRVRVTDREVAVGKGFHDHGSNEYVEMLI